MPHAHPTPNADPEITLESHEEAPDGTSEEETSEEEAPESEESPISEDPGSDADPFERVPENVREALRARGFGGLTAVQEAVLAPELAGRDIRISSQTGSGKTVALGFAIARLFTPGAPKGVKAIVIAPTRELAAQVRGELSWLFENINDGRGAHVEQVVGGTSIRDELRALSKLPDIVVATPGRLLDHLDRGSLDASGAKAVVLDEADQMLDLGFRDDLEAILGKIPEERQTILVSATFSRDVLALAKRYQKDAVSVEGTRLGEANVDISHEVHIVPFSHRNDAIVNLMLLAPEEQTLIFARTREGAANIARGLSDLGFTASPLTGDMDQAQRTRTLEAFRSGHITILVATDVAARGIDVPDVTRVIHADPPSNGEVYTHRSGRTGRAGRKGKSILILSPSDRESGVRIIRRARVFAEEFPVPTPEIILKAADERLKTELGAPHTDDEAAPDARVRRLATRLLAEVDPLTLVMRLLGRTKHAGPCPPREIPTSRPRPGFEGRDARALARPDARGPRAPREGGREPYAPRSAAGRELPPPRREGYAPRDAGPRDSGPRDAGPREARAPRESYAPRDAGPRFGGGEDRPVRERTERAPRTERPAAASNRTFRAFRITWGERHGADPRRILALVCRRGEIEGGDVGSIDVGPISSTIEIDSTVASSFESAAGKPDARDPRIRIEPADDAPRAPRGAVGGGGFPSAPPPARGAGGDKPLKRRIVR